jgi:hypothetical protein
MPSVPLAVFAPSPTPPFASAYRCLMAKDAQAVATVARPGAGLAPRPRTGTGKVYQRASAVYAPPPSGGALGTRAPSGGHAAVASF